MDIKKKQLQNSSPKWIYCVQNNGQCNLKNKRYFGTKLTDKQGQYFGFIAYRFRKITK